MTAQQRIEQFAKANHLKIYDFEHEEPGLIRFSYQPRTGEAKTYDRRQLREVVDTALRLPEHGDGPTRGLLDEGCPSRARVLVAFGTALAVIKTAH